jgi:tetratricopeptide (TPR) repeat protein
MSFPSSRGLVLLLALAVAWRAAATQPRAKQPPLPPVQEVTAALRHIESARLRGTLPQLRRDLESAARAHPHDAMRRFYAAWADFPSEECWNQLRTLSVFHPENPWPHLGMGLVYLRWRMPAEAGRSLDAALRVSPGLAPALVAEGQRLDLEGRTAEAEARYREALAQLDEPQARAALGLVLARTGRDAEARPLLEAAVAAWPDQPEALAVLARLVAEAGEARAAAALGEKRLALVPDDREAHRAQAEAWLALGDGAKALGLLERYEALGGTAPEALRSLARLAAEAGRTKLEARALERLEAVAPDDAGLHLRRAELALARGDMATVDGLLARTASTRLEGEWLVRRARLLDARGRLQEALVAFRAASGTPGAGEGAAALAARFRLPPSPARGTPDAIYRRVSVGLVALYARHLKEVPHARGVLKVRVTVDEAGRAEKVTLVQDTLGAPLVAGHAYFAFLDAKYPPGRSEQDFQYVFRPP